ncbi:acetylcholine receptor subunit alpha-L1-like isoform X2 [Littorina saxatilis]|uniref:Uncharacterized protein n=1 Tax=Littorina saxatilis TaxID=31220 RepID=A0AAN9BTA9_9CAEN
MAASVPAAVLANLPSSSLKRCRLLLLCWVAVFCQACRGVDMDSTTTDSSQHARRVPDEQRLYESIMAKYQQSVMPHVDNKTFPLTVAFSLRLNQIVLLDERQQVLTTNVFIDQTWIDPALAWDPLNFTDVRALRIPAEHVWLPDTFVYNNADGGTSGFMRGTYVQIQSNGRVLWPVPLRLRSSCSVQITYFPFDTQICTLRFGSWIYGLRQLDYTPLTDGLTVDPSTYVNNSEWELVSITMNKALSPPGGPAGIRKLVSHPHLTYVLYLKRNTFFYLFNIIVPCAMLSTLNILTFWLPPVSGEKVTLGLSVFLAFSMFMLLIAEEVPATSEAVPLIGVYLCMVMTMTSLSVIMAVVVTNLYHRGRKMRQAPRWLVTVCLHWLARPFCVLNDIPLVASTVDLAEHCQYDVSIKRKSQPRIAQILGLSGTTNTDTWQNNPSSSSSSRQNPALLPTHLQNGGNVSRVNHAPDVTRRENGRVENSGVLGSNRDKISAISAFFTGLGERKSTREVHPRARNSVVTSCHFTQIPTTDDAEDDDSVDGRPKEEGEEEEEVWVRRQSCPSSETEFDQRSHNTNQLKNGNSVKNNAEKEDEDEEDEEEEREVSQRLLSRSARPNSSTSRSTTNAGSSSQTQTPPKSIIRRASGKLLSKILKSHQAPGRSHKKLDPHPTSSDLQAARTMIAEWQQIATVVDRLMFVVYVLTTVIAYVVILVIAPANQPPVTELMLNAAGTNSVTKHWGG